MPKPVWTLDQIAAQLTRDHIAWAPSEPIAYTFYTQPWAHLGNVPNFSPFFAAQRQALADIFELVSDIIPLSFANVPDNGQKPGPGNERIGFYNLNSSTEPYWGQAWNTHTEPSGDQLGLISGSDVRVNLYRANKQGGWDPGDSNPRKLMHEALHSLGLPHPGDYDGASAPNYEVGAEYQQDSRQYTVMSYWEAAETGADHVVGWFTYYAATPLLHDIAALQKLYGANMATRTGDTVYGFNSTAGRAAYDIAHNPHPVFSIWDAGGVDTLDLSGFATASRIDLGEGAFSDAGEMTANISIAHGVTVENAIGGGGSDTLIGNAAANALRGGGGNDLLDGASGTDTLDGGAGADTMAGGDGDDTYLVDDGGDLAVETSATGGTDAVYSVVAFTLGANIEHLTLTGDEARNGSGNALANSLTGNSAANILDGGAGADIMAGGRGNDIYVVDNAADKAVEASAGDGVDTVRSSVGFTLGNHVENLVLTGTAAVSGTGNALANSLTGNAAANSLSGGGGNDLIDGRAGADSMSGGYGNDVYVVDHAADRVVELSGAGADAVRSSVGLTLADHVEKLVLTGSAAIAGTGNRLANQLYGNGAGNALAGGGGHDLIDGGLGNDRLNGGTGSDQLRGGAGADHFLFDAPLGTANVDKLLDFAAPSDSLYLNRSVFAAAGANGTLASSAFRKGSAAADSTDRIVYDQAAGKIFYDADGSGGGGAILFATVTPGAAMSYADFVIYG